MPAPGYKVLFTLANYRAGRPLFIGSDGSLRDAGGSLGRFASINTFAEVFDLAACRSEIQKF